MSAGVQVIQTMVPEKYKMRLGDACVDLEGKLRSEYILLKESGLYCFLLRLVNLKQNRLWTASSGNSKARCGEELQRIMTVKQALIEKVFESLKMSYLRRRLSESSQKENFIYPL